MPPLMLAASGGRMLRLAAREADIVSFTVITPDPARGKVIDGTACYDSIAFNRVWEIPPRAARSPADAAQAFR